MCICLNPLFLLQEYETKSGRAGPGNPTSPRRSVRKNLDFEPLSTTALILEDRPAYVNIHTHTHTVDPLVVGLSHIFYSLSLTASGVYTSENKASVSILPHHSFFIGPPSSAGSLPCRSFQLTPRPPFVSQTVKEKCCWKFNGPPSAWLHYPAFLFCVEFAFCLHKNRRTYAGPHWASSNTQWYCSTACWMKNNSVI